MIKTPRHDIAKVLAERSLGRIDGKSLSKQIASYLLSEGRTADVEPLLRDIMQYRAEAGIVEAVAVTAHPLTSELRTQVRAQVMAAIPQAKQIIISEEIRPSMLGGVRIELPTQQFDLSVRAKLSRFKQLTTTGL
jgi:F0F1-type ATP synthase delta subunit